MDSDVSLTALTASGVTSGEHVLAVTANATHQFLYVDGVLEDNGALAANVTNNANDWIFMSDATAYSDNISITVNGTQALLYQPVTYIVGNNLPDLAGTSQNGTITWGNNDTGISVVVGSLLAFEEAVGTEPETGIPTPVGIVRGPDLFPTEIQMKSTLHIFYDVAEDMSDVTGFPVQFFWWFGCALMTVCAMVATMKWLPNIWWMGVVGIFALGMGVAQAFIPGWFIILGVLAVIFAVLTERTPAI